mgnify:CR=1 FL=1
MHKHHHSSGSHSESDHSSSPSATTSPGGTTSPCPCPEDCCTTATVTLNNAGNVIAVSDNLVDILEGCGITVGGTPPIRPPFVDVFACLCNAGLRFVTTIPATGGGAQALAIFVFCD